MKEIFTTDKTVRYYHGEMFDWIRTNYTDPVNVWLFSSEGDKYDQYVTSSGEIYRMESLQRAMEEFAGKYTNEKSHDDAKSYINELTTTSFIISSIAAQFAREKNSWKLTKSKFVKDVRISCVEYGYGGLWNTRYDLNSIMSVDMIVCYPESFLGGGECHEYFKRLGLPTHRMVRRAVNGPLPSYDLTGFAFVTSFKLAERLHPVNYLDWTTFT